MAPDKSLAAEIEAVLIGVSKAAAEIASLQSRAFEDGARWMREAAATTIHEPHGPTGWVKHFGNNCPISGAIATAIAALPLQPEGKRNA